VHGRPTLREIPDFARAKIESKPLVYPGVGVPNPGESAIFVPSSPGG
jgi:hypothetical protein